MKSDGNSIEVINESGLLCVKLCFKIFVIQNVYNRNYFMNQQKIMQTKTTSACRGELAEVFTAPSLWYKSG